MKKRSGKSSLEAIRNYGFTKDVYREELMTQLEQLNILCEEMEKVIMVDNGRVGSKEITGSSGNERIRASSSNGCRQFYFFDPASHKKRYAKVSELQQIIVSAQKEYDTKAFEKIRKLKDTLQKFLMKYDIEEIEKIYDNYCKAKQEIIADLFSQYRVPYQYEPELILDNGHKACPDFVVLNVRSRKTFYWEHFGMISKFRICDKKLEKDFIV